MELLVYFGFFVVSQYERFFEQTGLLSKQWQPRQNAHSKVNFGVLGRRLDTFNNSFSGK